jgi:RimJ/RimL family protein N-acetyltransferase
MLRNVSEGDLQTFFEHQQVPEASSMAAYPGRRLVGYWIGSEYWGRGIARSALEEFLRTHETQRPIYAYVAVSNPRSIRVLEKCGFRRAGEPTVGSDGVAELLFLFDGAA